MRWTWNLTSGTNSFQPRTLYEPRKPFQPQDLTTAHYKAQFRWGINSNTSHSCIFGGSVDSLILVDAVAMSFVDSFANQGKERLPNRWFVINYQDFQRQVECLGDKYEHRHIEHVLHVTWSLKKWRKLTPRDGSLQTGIARYEHFIGVSQLGHGPQPMGINNVINHPLAPNKSELLKIVQTCISNPIQGQLTHAFLFYWGMIPKLQGPMHGYWGKSYRLLLPLWSVLPSVLPELVSPFRIYLKTSDQPQNRLQTSCPIPSL